MNSVSVAAESLDGLRLNFALQAGILRRLSRQEHFVRRRRMREDCSYRPLVSRANRETDGQRLLEMRRLPNVAYARLILLGTALGAHGGPGMLVVSLQEYAAPRPFADQGPP